MRDYASTTMTCVGQYLGNTLKVGGTAFQFALYRNGVGEQLYIVVGWYPGTTGQGDLTTLLQCTVNGTTYAFTTREGWDDPVCVVPYLLEESDTATYALVPANSRINMTYNGNKKTEYRLSPGAYTTMPTLTLTGMPTLYGNYNHTVRWNLTAADDCNGWVVGMTMRVRESGGQTVTETALFSDKTYVYYTLQTDGTIVGKEVCLVLEYRSFPRDWNGYDQGAFVTRNRYTTPWQTVSRDAAIPLAPTGLTTSLLLAGGRVLVRWNGVTDPLNTISGYRLERCINGGSYKSLYSGTSTQFRDTLPNSAKSVVYRVCAVNNRSAVSPWTDSGTLAVAQSNLYVAKDGKWVRAAGVWIGDKRASPMVQVGGK